MNIHFCRIYQRFVFQKTIDGIKYKKIFRTRPEAEYYRDLFYITYYNGKSDI